MSLFLIFSSFDISPSPFQFLRTRLASAYDWRPSTVTAIPPIIAYHVLTNLDSRDAENVAESVRAVLVKKEHDSDRELLSAVQSFSSASELYIIDR